MKQPKISPGNQTTKIHNQNVDHLAIYTKSKRKLTEDDQQNVDLIKRKLEVVGGYRKEARCTWIEELVGIIYRLGKVIQRLKI